VITMSSRLSVGTKHLFEIGDEAVRSSALITSGAASIMAQASHEVRSANRLAANGGSKARRACSERAARHLVEVRGLVDEHPSGQGQTGPDNDQTMARSHPHDRLAQPHARLFFKGDVVPLEEPPDGQRGCPRSPSAHRGQTISSGSNQDAGDQSEKPSACAPKASASTLGLAAALPNRRKRCTIDSRTHAHVDGSAASWP